MGEDLIERREDLVESSPWCPESTSRASPRRQLHNADVRASKRVSDASRWVSNPGITLVPKLVPVCSTVRNQRDMPEPARPTGRARARASDAIESQFQSLGS